MLKKVVIAALLVLGVAVQARAQTTPVVDGTITSTTSGEIVFGPTGSLGTATIQLTGTWAGTYTIEGSLSDTCHLNTGTWATLPNTSSLTSNGLTTVSVAAVRCIRVQDSGWSSGTTSVRIMGAEGGGGAGSGGTASSVSITQGGNTAQVNASSQLSVTCANCSGSGVSVNEDVASADGQAGTPAYAVRNDTVTGGTSADGDYQPLKSDAAGRLYVTGTGGTFPLPTGASTAAKQPALGTAGTASADVITVQGIASMTALKVDGSAVTQPVSGSITCSNCSGTGVSVNEDVASANADPGTPAYTVRNNTLTGATSADGDYQPLKSTAAGAIYVAPTFADAVVSTGNGVSGTGVQRVTIASDSTGTVAATQSGTWNVTNVSGTVSLPTGASTSANQSTEITALQLIDNLPNTAGSTTSGSSGALGMCATTTSAPTNTTAQNNFLSCDTSGALRVVGSAGTTQYTEDAAATDGAALVAVGAIRRDTTPSSSAGTAGDNSQLTTDANGRLYTNSTLYTPNGDSAMNDTADAVKSLLVDTTGTALTQDTQATHDGALTPASSTGGLLFGRARSSAPTAVTADDASLINTTLVGDLRMAQVDSSGAYVTPDTQLTHDGAMTPASTTGAATLCRARSSLATAVSAQDDAVLLACDMSGQVLTATAGYEDAAETAGAPLAMAGSVRRDTAASSAGTTGDNATINTDASGLLWTRLLDPCSGNTKTTTPISSTVDLAIITATSGKKNYICSISLVAAAAEVISIWEGTGTACGTGSAAIAGSTTEANGMSLAANGGFAITGGAGVALAGITANVDTCLRISGSNRVSGFVTWVQQ